MQFHSASFCQSFMPHVPHGCFGCHVVCRKIVLGHFSAIIKVWYLDLWRLQNFLQVKNYWPNGIWMFNCTLLINGLRLSCLLLSCSVPLIWGHQRFFLIYGKGLTHFFLIYETFIYNPNRIWTCRKKFLLCFILLLLHSDFCADQTLTYVEVAVRVFARCRLSAVMRHQRRKWFDMQFHKSSDMIADCIFWKCILPPTIRWNKTFSCCRSTSVKFAFMSTIHCPLLNIKFYLRKIEACLGKSW